MMNLRYKIWLEQSNRKAFGDGPYRMLRLVDQQGSLSRAARAMDMSYSQAWNLIKSLEQRLGFCLIQSQAGGKFGGGSSLTPAARALVEKYEKFMTEAGEMLHQLYKKHFY